MYTKDGALIQIRMKGKMLIFGEEEKKALDSRNYPFFKILYTETGADDVSMARGGFVMVTLAVMAACCLVSAVRSSTAEQLLDNLKGFHLETMVLMVAINECINRKRVRRIMAYIEKSWKNPRYGLPGEEKIMLEARNKALTDMNFLVIMFAANFPLMMLTKPVTEALSGHSWKQLPFPWTVLPNDDDTTFVGFLLFHTLGVFFSHCLGIVAMCFSTITTQITALFDVLLLGIEHIEERAARKMKQQGLTYQDSMLMCIKESIAHHQELVQEVRSEKPHLENHFFADIVNISMIMACEAFPLIRPNLTVSIAIKGLVFLVVQVLCTAVVCDRMEIMADQAIVNTFNLLSMIRKMS